MSPEEEQDILEYIRITGMSKERLVSISRGEPFTGEIPRLYTQSQLDQALSELQAKILAAVEALRLNHHVHHGSYVQGHNKAIDASLSAISEVTG